MARAHSNCLIQERKEGREAREGVKKEETCIQGLHLKLTMERLTCFCVPSFGYYLGGASRLIVVSLCFKSSLQHLTRTPKIALTALSVLVLDLLQFIRYTAVKLISLKMHTLPLQLPSYSQVCRASPNS